MATLSTLEAKPPKILIYGPAGCGKTVLFLTLGRNAQLLDLDDNVDVAFGLKDSHQPNRLQVDVEQFLDELPSRPRSFMNLKKRVIKITNECNKGDYPFQILGIDSLTALSVASQRYIMGNSGDPDENPQIQHWGMLLNEIENIVIKLRALPIPVFVLAHETTFTSDDINKVEIAIPGQKLPGKITRMFSEIWYLRLRQAGQGKQEFYIQTAPTSSITCRSGRGLESGTVIGCADKKGSPVGTHPSLWDLLERIGWTQKKGEPTT